VKTSLFQRIEAVPTPRDAEAKTLRLCFTETDAINGSIALCGLTYREIAARMGKSKSLVNALAKGERQLTEKNTIAFCHATGTNLVRQWRAMDRAMREAAGQLRARDRIAAIVEPTQRAWGQVA